jgi:sporulation protein YlmC with PRC-barrel domain
MTTTTMEKRAGLLTADEITGSRVINPAGEDLGKLEKLMLDLDRGRVAYAVLSFGGFLGMGDKLFAIPFQALKRDEERDLFVLNVDKEKLKKAPGFDKNHWPDTADRTWGSQVHSYYGFTPYWQ